MGNMGYCRFRNTLTDLRDCRDHMGDDDLSQPEKDARKLLYDLCVEIVEDNEFLADGDD